MDEVLDPQLLKGILPILLLTVLRESEEYGYAIVKKLHDLGFTSLKEGTVYPALTRLEAKRFLSSRLAKSTSGPARKYYSLTDVGLGELQKASESWAMLTAKVDHALRATAGEESA